MEMHPQRDALKRCCLSGMMRSRPLKLRERVPRPGEPQPRRLWSSDKASRPEKSVVKTVPWRALWVVSRGGVIPNVLGSLGGLSIGQRMFESKFCPGYQEDSAVPGTRTEGGTEKRDCGDILNSQLDGLGARSRQRQAKNISRGFSQVPADPALPPRQSASAKKLLGPLKR